MKVAAHSQVKVEAEGYKGQTRRPRLEKRPAVISGFLIIGDHRLSVRTRWEKQEGNKYLFLLFWKENCLLIKVQQQGKTGRWNLKTTMDTCVFPARQLDQMTCWMSRRFRNPIHFEAYFMAMEKWRSNSCFFSFLRVATGQRWTVFDLLSMFLGPFWTCGCLHDPFLRLQVFKAVCVHTTKLLSVSEKDTAENRQRARKGWEGVPCSPQICKILH